MVIMCDCVLRRLVQISWLNFRTDRQGAVPLRVPHFHSKVEMFHCIFKLRGALSARQT
jgi:hypothetical protein